jgi:hypothetical protein
LIAERAHAKAGISRNPARNQIDSSDEQLSKANGSTIESFESDSKCTFDRFPQSPKQAREIISTDEGMQIACSPEHRWKACLPRLAICDLASNVNSDSLLQRAKHLLGIASIDDGRQID